MTEQQQAWAQMQVGKVMKPWGTAIRSRAVSFEEGDRGRGVWFNLAETERKVYRAYPKGIR